MKYVMLAAVLFFTIPAVAQTATNVWTPQYIAIDSTDDVFVALK